MATFPKPTDEVASLTRADGTTEAHSSDHGRVIEMWENVLHHGAKGDSATDDTAAFQAAITAAGDGGTVYAPPGHVYVIGDLTAVQNGTIHIKGGGSPYNATPPGGGTILKAKSGATYILKILGSFMSTVEDLMLDGNNGATTGVLLDGDTYGCQENMFKNVWWVRCNYMVIHGNSGPGGQVDKTTYLHCREDEGNDGLWLQGVNTQHTVLINTTIASCNRAVRMASGGLTWFGGGTGSCENTITFEGSTVDQVTLIDVITENSKVGGIDIDGRTHMPYKSIKAINCTFAMTDGDIADIGVFGVFTAEGCSFGSDIVFSGTTGARFEDSFCRFENGKDPVTGTSPGIYNPGANSNTTRYSLCAATPAASDHQFKVYGGPDGDELMFSYGATGDAAGAGTITGENLQTGNSGKVYFGTDLSVFLAKLDATTLWTNMGIYSEPFNATDIAFGTVKSGESVLWLSILTNGKMTWGPGGGVIGDTSLERSAANVLALGANDALRTGLAVETLPAATGYAAGSQFYCITHNQPVWSNGTIWLEADGTNH